MKSKTKQSKAGERKTGESVCVCQGIIPALTEFLREMGPPETARQHFHTARIELLKGIRAVIDARIEQVSKSKVRGQKISVE